VVRVVDSADVDVRGKSRRTDTRLVVEPLRLVEHAARRPEQGRRHGERGSGAEDRRIAQDVRAVRPDHLRPAGRAPLVAVADQVVPEVGVQVGLGRGAPDPGQCRVLLPERPVGRGRGEPHLQPAERGTQHLVKHGVHIGVRRQLPADAAVDQHRGRHPVRSPGRGERGDERAHRVADDDRPVEADRVEHGDQVIDMPGQAARPRHVPARCPAGQVRRQQPYLPTELPGDRQPGQPIGGDPVHREDDRRAPGRVRGEVVHSEPTAAYVHLGESSHAISSRSRRATG
jgi:hypothetical protein